MTPGADMWVSEAWFCVTWCPTFKIGYVISCLVQDTVPFKTDPSGGLWHMYKSDSCVVLVQIHAVDHVFCKKTHSFLHYFSSITAWPLFPLNTCSCWVPSSLLLPTLSLNLPFRDVTSCHGNCLRPLLLMEGAAAAAISQLDSVARQQVTWCSLATTLLQEPANPLNLSLSPFPNTSIFFSIPLYISLLLLSKTAFSPLNPKPSGVQSTPSRLGFKWHKNAKITPIIIARNCKTAVISRFSNF